MTVPPPQKISRFLPAAGVNRLTVIEEPTNPAPARWKALGMVVVFTVTVIVGLYPGEFRALLGGLGR